MHAILQAEESLTDMGVASVDILYLHAPDLDTPIERTLEGGWRDVVWSTLAPVVTPPCCRCCCTACQKLYEAGKFRELGLSNYPAVSASVGSWSACAGVHAANCVNSGRWCTSGTSVTATGG